MPSDPSLGLGSTSRTRRSPERKQLSLGHTSQPQRPKARERCYLWVRTLGITQLSASLQFPGQGGGGEQREAMASPAKRPGQGGPGGWEAES